MYAPMLNSITGCWATYGMEFSVYEEMSRELAVRVVEEHRAGKPPWSERYFSAGFRTT